MSTLREASLKVGSGLVPCALYRDLYAVNAGASTYTINWSAITKPVLWIDTELGYGENWYGASQISIHSPYCKTYLISKYGHLDVLASPTAKTRFWYRFIE